MLDISFHYKTKRVNFGRHFNQEDTPVKMIASIEPDPELRAKFEDINPFSIDVQTAVTYSSHIVNTEVTQTKNQDVVHKEGSWPEKTDPTDAPACKQLRLKAEKREGFVKQVKDLAATQEKTTKLNVAIDLFSDHFPQTEQPTVVSEPSIRTISILRDKFTDRFVSSLSWSETGNAKRVAICYTPNNISKPDVHYESFIYNLECSSVPEMELHPSSPLMCLEYNQKDNNYLVGGMAHGSLSLWDVRSGSLPVWTSAIESSHRGAVYNVKWISSKTAFECVSVSEDGCTMTWDTRNQTTPLEVISLNPAPELLPAGFSAPFGGRVLDYHTGVPTKYMVGTVEGLVMNVNRKASDPNSRISGVFSSHYGPIYAVRRHPTETKYFLTASDWSVRIFSEDNKTSLINLPAQRNYLTSAVWGLGRTSVIFTGNCVGGVDAWDIQTSHRAPLTSIQVGNAAIRTMVPEASGEYIMAGDADGTATLLQLNEPLKNPQTATEKTGFIGMLSREAKRVKNYDMFLKEQKMREKAKASRPEEKQEDEEATFNPDEIEAEFERALSGQIEVVTEKKRVIIGEEDNTQPAEEDKKEKTSLEGLKDVVTDALTGEEEEEKKGSPKKEEEDKKEPTPKGSPKKEEEERKEPTPKGSPKKEEEDKKEPTPKGSPKKEEEDKREDDKPTLGGLSSAITDALTGEEEEEKKKEEEEAKERAIPSEHGEEEAKKEEEEHNEPTPKGSPKKEEEEEVKERALPSEHGEEEAKKEEEEHKEEEEKKREEEEAKEPSPEEDKAEPKASLTGVGNMMANALAEDDDDE